MYVSTISLFHLQLLFHNHFLHYYHTKFVLCVAVLFRSSTIQQFSSTSFCQRFASFYTSLFLPSASYFSSCLLNLTYVAFRKKIQRAVSISIDSASLFFNAFVHVYEITPPLLNTADLQNYHLSASSLKALSIL
jgi:hypothetical protein